MDFITGFGTLGFAVSWNFAFQLCTLNQSHVPMPCANPSTLNPARTVPRKDNAYCDPKQKFFKIKRFLNNNEDPTIWRVHEAMFPCVPVSKRIRVP